MQPDDPSITPVSTAAAAMAFSNFLVPLIDHAFLPVGTTLPKNGARRSDAIAVLSTRVQYRANSGKSGAAGFKPQLVMSLCVVLGPIRRWSVSRSRITHMGNSCAPGC